MRHIPSSSEDPKFFICVDLPGSACRPRVDRCEHHATVCRAGYCIFRAKKRAKMSRIPARELRVEEDKKLSMDAKDGGENRAANFKSEFSEQIFLRLRIFLEFFTDKTLRSLFIKNFHDRKSMRYHML